MEVKPKTQKEEEDIFAAILCICKWKTDNLVLEECGFLFSFNKTM